MCECRTGLVSTDLYFTLLEWAIYRFWENITNVIESPIYLFSWKCVDMHLFNNFFVILLFTLFLEASMISSYL